VQPFLLLVLDQASFPRNTHSHFWRSHLGHLWQAKVAVSIRAPTIVHLRGISLLVIVRAPVWHLVVQGEHPHLFVIVCLRYFFMQVKFGRFGVLERLVRVRELGLRASPVSSSFLPQERILRVKLVHRDTVNVTGLFRSHNRPSHQRIFAYHWLTFFIEVEHPNILSWGKAAHR